MVSDRRRARSDRRQGQRVGAVFAVKNQVGARVELGQAEDINLRGMTLRRPEHAPFEPETPLALCFELPGQEAEIAVHGVVVQDRGAGSFRRTGVRFTGLGTEQARRIAAYCRRWRGRDVKSPG
jgi:hypothetical protein